MLFKLFLQFGRASFLSAQLEKPSGLFGRFIIARMLDQGNENLHTFCLELMQIQSGENILEIGFGTGAVLPRIAAVSNPGLTTGIDFSPDMVRLARKRNARAIKKGQIEIQEADLKQIPFADESFDKIYTANTLYFWPEPENNAREIMRVLRPGGELYLAFRPRRLIEKLSIIDKRFTLYEEDEVQDLFRRLGFENCEIRMREHPDTAGSFASYCAIVKKSGAGSL